jgi:hypothetical protein
MPELFSTSEAPHLEHSQKRFTSFLFLSWLKFALAFRACWQLVGFQKLYVMAVYDLLDLAAEAYVDSAVGTIGVSSSQEATADRARV